MFGQVIDKFDKWLGPSFLLSYFSPWVAFVSSNLVMVYLTFPSAARIIDHYLQGEPADKVVIIAVITAGIGVAAYVTAPLIRVLTEILEGRHLPPSLAGDMTKIHTDHLDRLDKERESLLAVKSQVEDVKTAYVALQTAKNLGDSGRRVLDPDRIKDAEAAISPLREARRRNELIKVAAISNAVTALLAALERNCSDPNKLDLSVDHDPRKDSAALARLHDELVNKNRLIDYAINIATQKHSLARIKRYNLFARTELAPTRLGNDAAALRSYCETRYNIDFDFFWPRLQIIFQRDALLSSSLVNAKVQLDFAVLLLWLTALFTATWLIALSIFGHSIIVFAMVAAFGPIAARVWLRIVEASYSGFAELVRSAIDLKRLDLLKAFHIPDPENAAAEKAAWDTLGHWLLIGGKDEIKYTSPLS